MTGQRKRVSSELVVLPVRNDPYRYMGAVQLTFSVGKSTKSCRDDIILGRQYLQSIYPVRNIHAPVKLPAPVWIKLSRNRLNKKFAFDRSEYLNKRRNLDVFLKDHMDDEDEAELYDEHEMTGVEYAPSIATTAASCLPSFSINTSIQTANVPPVTVSPTTMSPTSNGGLATYTTHTQASSIIRTAPTGHHQALSQLQQAGHGSATALISASGSLATYPGPSPPAGVATLSLSIPIPQAPNGATAAFSKTTSPAVGSLSISPIAPLPTQAVATAATAANGPGALLDQSQQKQQQGPANAMLPASVPLVNALLVSRSNGGPNTPTLSGTIQPAVPYPTQAERTSGFKKPSARQLYPISSHSVASSGVIKPIAAAPFPIKPLAVAPLPAAKISTALAPITVVTIPATPTCTTAASSVQRQPVPTIPIQGVMTTPTHSQICGQGATMTPPLTHVKSCQPPTSETDEKDSELLALEADIESELILALAAEKKVSASVAQAIPSAQGTGRVNPHTGSTSSSSKAQNDDSTNRPVARCRRRRSA